MLLFYFWCMFSGFFKLPVNNLLNSLYRKPPLEIMEVFRIKVKLDFYQGLTSVSSSISLL